MDKRTLSFVVLLSATLFVVNLFFQWNNQDALQKWNEQQLIKKQQKEAALSSGIAERTAKAEELPLVTLYGDKEQKNPVLEGVSVGDNILAVRTTEKPLQTIYSKNHQEYTLVFASENISDPLVYRKKGSTELLQIGDLPDFGKFDLQVVLLPNESRYKIVLGEYLDGIFSYPQYQLDKLRKEINHDAPAPKKPSADGIVLLKNGKNYLPIGVYQAERKDILYIEELPELTQYVEKPKTEFKTSGGSKQEKFYVLENGYQQLVFSNHGGALAEINLPFESKSDKESVVKEIEFDRQMVKSHPYNALFPAHSYHTPGKDPKGPYIEHAKGRLGGYYPLIRRDLIETGKQKTVHVSPRYYALNFLSEYPELSELVYEVKHFDNKKIIFEAVQRNRRITKTFSIEEETKGAPYCLDLVINIEGDSRGLWINSGVPEVEWISGAPAPALMYRITRNHKSNVEPIDLPKESTTVTSVFPDWICNSNGFLGMILDPLTETDPGYKVQFVPGTTVPSRLVEIDQEFDKFQAQSLPGYMTLLPLKTGGGSMHFRVFAGPFSTQILKTVDATYSNPATGVNPDYIACQTFHGWFAFISEPFAKFLFILMDFFHSVTGSWAFSIILLTVALRAMLYPLNAWSTKSMLKMQQITPQVAIIQEKYKNDPKKVQIEIMNLYRDNGVNPVSGCLPLLIQMPFLIGMFDLLKSTFELRGASFIPGWIDNLTAPDVLFSWSQPIFFIGNEFHLLPILLGAVMFLQQRLSSTLPKDPSLWTDQQRQQRSMGSIMAVVFAVMFYNFPSGLNIYWLSSMLLGILQQWWTQRTMKASAP